MKKHLRLLGIAHVIIAGFHIAIGLLMLVFFAVIQQMLPREATFLGWIVGIVPMFFILVSLPGLLAGMGLMNHRGWARILAMIVAVFHIPNLPIGTGLGIYTFWVLTNDEAVAALE